MKKCFIIFCCLISFSILQASKRDTIYSSAKIKFSSIQSIGLLGNEINAHPIFQMILGAQYKRFFTGVGAGIDPYFSPSIPMFVDVRYNFFQRRLAAYGYGDLGINRMFNYQQRYPETWSNGDQAYRFKTGLYYDLGVGIKTHIAGQLFYNLAMGISFKESKYRYTSMSWPNYQPSAEIYRNVASRFVIKMGLQF